MLKLINRDTRKICYSNICRPRGSYVQNQIFQITMSRDTEQNKNEFRTNKLNSIVEYFTVQNDKKECDKYRPYIQ